MAKLEYYVDPLSGSDTTGDGLSDGTAWQSIQHALNNITKNTADGDRINVKDTADDVLSAELDFTTIGNYTQTHGLLIQGYTSTAGDGGIGGISGGGTTGIITTVRNYIAFKDMHLHNTGSNNILDIVQGALEGCEFDNSSSTGNIVKVNESSVCNCYFHNTDGNALYMNRGLAFGNYFKQGGTYSFDTALNLNALSCAVRNIISIDGASNGITSLGSSISVMNNSILSAGGTGAGIEPDSLNYGSSFINNLVEGFSGTGGKGINKVNKDMVNYSHNSVYNCETDLASDGQSIIAHDNESLGASPFAKTGADTFENRFAHFAPADVGNVLSGGLTGHTRGAVANSAGGGGTTYSLHPLAYN